MESSQEAEQPPPLSFDAFAFLFHDPTLPTPTQPSNNTPRHAYAWWKGYENIIYTSRVSTKDLSFADESLVPTGKTGGKTGGKAGDSSKTQKSHSAKAGLQ
ncbi:hypothetical protein KCU98_g15412, partial [Aureobasidium melanogenum]